MRAKPSSAREAVVGRSTEVAVILVAWLGGWHTGLLAGIAVPGLSVPVILSFGIPAAAVFRDFIGFEFISVICGGSVGLLSTMFGEAVSTQREIRRLYHVLPICSHCHSIRKGDNRWQSLEAFVKRSGFNSGEETDSCQFSNR